MRRKIVSWTVFGLGVVMVVRLGAGVGRLVQAGKQAESARRELAAAQAENQQLTERLEEVKDPEFILKEAREKLGLGKPGEAMIILPKLEQESRRVEEFKKEEPNWREWWKLWVRI